MARAQAVDVRISSTASFGYGNWGLQPGRVFVRMLCCSSGHIVAPTMLRKYGTDVTVVHEGASETLFRMQGLAQARVGSIGLLIVGLRKDSSPVNETRWCLPFSLRCSRWCLPFSLQCSRWSSFGIPVFSCGALAVLRPNFA